MDSSKASDGDSIYLIVAKLRQPRNLLRTIAIRLRLGCNLIDVKALSYLALFKDYLVELMFPL
jgi:hypothetical protein